MPSFNALKFPRKEVSMLVYKSILFLLLVLLTSTADAQELPLEIKVSLLNNEIQQRFVTYGNPVAGASVNIEVKLVNTSNEALKLYGLRNCYAPFWKTDNSNVWASGGPICTPDITILKPHEEIIVPAISSVSFDGDGTAKVVKFRLVYRWVKQSDYPDPMQFMDFSTLYFEKPWENFKKNIKYQEIKSAPISVELLAAEALPVYEKEWKKCAQKSDCLSVREGENWTCVNKNHEMDARGFFRTLFHGESHQFCIDDDPKSEEKRRFGPVEAVCVKGMCICEDPVVSKSSTERDNTCLKDADCKVESAGWGWTATNKNYHGYYFSTGDTCAARMQYPPPEAYCVGGKCRFESELNGLDKFLRR